MLKRGGWRFRECCRGLDALLHAGSLTLASQIDQSRHRFFTWGIWLIKPQVRQLKECSFAAGDFFHQRNPPFVVHGS